MSAQHTDSTNSTRRGFLKTSTAATTTAALAAAFPGSARAFQDSQEILKVGLIGCGGRGSGAAKNALYADPYTRLVAMGDVFEEKLENSLKGLKNEGPIADHVEVDEEHKFIGLDAFQKVIDCVDVVILTTPPGFRPQHLRAAVEADKHIFTEKPMATDGPGVRSVIESVEISKVKGLHICAGFCWRYDNAKRALFEKVHEGALGELRAVYGTYLTGPVKPMPPADTRPAGMSDLEWMVRNWYNFTWLSGDGLVEQAVHTVDWLAWAFQDTPALSCTAVGGRQIPANGGNIYDHVEVNYLWESGARGFLAQRQTSGCYNQNGLYLLGTKGIGEIGPRGVSIHGETDWRYRGPSNNMYQTEHDEFFLSIRDGKPFNNGDRMWKSTLMAIMGRMAGYTGQEITWQMALDSQEKLVPEIDGWDTPVEERPMAQPGTTPFV